MTMFNNKLRQQFNGSSNHPADIDYIRTNIPCQWACPALTNVPSYIEAIFRNDPNKSYLINRRSNIFPGVLGRICSRPCEDKCRHGDADLGNPVAICHLKRFASDYQSDDIVIPEFMFPPTGKKVAVVGAGPAGLTVAHSLAIFGHSVTVFEANTEPGGMLYYGIPEFRLPRSVLSNEIARILRLGIKLKTNKRLGKQIGIESLLAEFDATVMSTGCYRVNQLPAQGTDKKGMHYGLEFMMRLNTGKPPKIGNDIIVIGGGFTAMDCARTARRLGAKNVKICILDTVEDLTVTQDEIIETKREGVEFISLVSSTAILGDESVERIRFKRNRFSVTEGGVKTAVPIEGSEFELPADTVIAAIGQHPDLNGLGPHITFNQNTGKASQSGLFGSGDFISGASTVISAIGHSRQVAVEVDKFLIGRRRWDRRVIYKPADDTHRKRIWDFIDLNHIPLLKVEDRFDGLNAEVETGFDFETAKRESQRCYLCNLKYEIYIPDCIYCRWCIDVCPRDCIELISEFDPKRSIHTDNLKTTENWNEVSAVVIDNDRCIRCGECLRICPTQCIHVMDVNLIDRFIGTGSSDHDE